MKIAYKSRIADAVLADKLSYMGAVLVRGPKWCGKTTTCEQIAKSAIYMDDPELSIQNQDYAAINVKDLLRGDRPRLIDEWQLAPQFWDAVRYEVDHSPGLGHFILTGSSVPADQSEIFHSGAGRFAWMKMRPMSLWESGESSGTISISELIAGKEMTTEDARPLGLEEIAFILCRGGWPEAVAQSGKAAIWQAFDYVDGVAESDISRFDGVARDPERARTLMRSYARLQGTQAGIGVITEDLSEHEGMPISENTVNSYLNALRGIFVIDDVTAWHPNLRRKTTIRTSDTRYFADPSIATAALGVGPDALMDDLPTFGLLFETMAIRDLRAYADALDASVHHYLDRNGLECDAVFRMRDGRYGLVEVKLGGDELVEAGCSSLNKLSSLIDTAKMRQPAFKMVLTAVGEYAYRRKEDGIFICPLSSLKP